MKIKVILFRESGKYYTEEKWEMPLLYNERQVLTPHDMINSVDFRRIDNGKVLVETQEPWGYPCLL